MLLILVPPALEFAIVGPLVIPVALSLVLHELPCVLISTFERQNADAIFIVSGPLTDVQTASRPLKDPEAIHFIRLPMADVYSFLIRVPKWIQPKHPLAIRSFQQLRIIPAHIQSSRLLFQA